MDDRLIGSAFGEDRIERRLSGDRFRSCYLLRSGRWLLCFPSPPELTEEQSQVWLNAVQALIRFPHPHLAAYVEVTRSDQHFWVVLQDPKGVPLSEFSQAVQPNPRLLLNWASQLGALGCHLVNSNFPVGSGFARAEHLWTRDSELLMLDPGLAELLWQECDSDGVGAAIQRFGTLLHELAGPELPPNLEWIAARCQADAGLRYHDFDELDRAFRQALVVDVPEISRPATDSALPLLPSFETPVVVSASPFPWGRLFLFLPLMMVALWGLWSWYHRPLPPRSYPAAVLACKDGLVLLDLNSGATRRRLNLPSQPVATLRAGDWLLVLCRGQRNLQVFHSRTLLERRGPAIDPNPDAMVADADGKWLYFLYSSRARVLLVKLPATPVAYLDTPRESRLLQPVSLPGEDQPGLLVASENPSQLQCFSQQKRLPERTEKLAEVDHLAVDGHGFCWVNRATRLERLTRELQVDRKLTLAAPAGALLAAGPRLLCTQPAGLAILEHPDDTGVRYVRLAGEPRSVRADPSNQQRVWFLQGGFLVCLDLATGQEIRRWLLPEPSEGLTILP